MLQKIIDVYCLWYLNDLFGIKLIILRSELNVATFWICIDIVFNNFLLIDATDRSKISSDINVKTAKPSLVSHTTQGRFIDGRNWNKFG